MAWLLFGAVFVLEQQQSLSAREIVEFGTLWKKNFIK
jgi:hypothetical protein